MVSGEVNFPEATKALNDIAAEASEIRAALQNINESLANLAEVLMKLKDRL